MKEIIGYQGITGSNSEIAGKEFIHLLNIKEFKLVPLIGSEQVVTAILNKEVDFGVMAIHNTLGGIVRETEKTIKDKPLSIVTTVRLRIHHCLFAKCKQDEITKIVSHEQALLQCKKTLAKSFKGIEQISIEDTAIGATRIISGEYAESTAVLCSKSIGNELGLNLILANAEDSEDNYTTFGFYQLK